MQHYGIMTLTNPVGMVQSRATHTELDTSSVMTGLVGVRVWQQADVYYTGQDYPPVTSVITGLQGLPYGDGGPDNDFSFAAPWLTGNGYTYNVSQYAMWHVHSTAMAPLGNGFAAICSLETPCSVFDCSDLPVAAHRQRQPNTPPQPPAFG